MKLRYSPSSLADLDAILGYISTHSPQGAIKVKGRIRAIIDMIAAHPFSALRPTIRPFAAFQHHLTRT
jgi:toxin ParE1/3/4